MTNQSTAVAVATQTTQLTQAQLSTLKNSLYPGASDAAIGMVIDYCLARGLDPMKKPCHIVPIYVKKAGGGGEMRDVIMPGIYELRTTAMRTGCYLGQSEPEYGETREYPITVAPDSDKIRAPEFVKVRVIRRMNEKGDTATFIGIARFTEVVGTNQDGNINARWQRAPFQMTYKCAEADALRRAFPDELGGEYASEELEGKVIELHAARELPAPPRQPQSKAAAAKPAASGTAATAAPANGEKISQGQFNTISAALTRAAGGDAELHESMKFDICQANGIEKIDDLPGDPAKVNQVLAWIKENGKG